MFPQWIFSLQVVPKQEVHGNPIQLIFGALLFFHLQFEAHLSLVFLSRRKMALIVAVRNLLVGDREGARGGGERLARRQGRHSGSGPGPAGAARSRERR